MSWAYDATECESCPDMTHVGVRLEVFGEGNLYVHESPRGETFRTLTDTTAIPCS